MEIVEQELARVEQADAYQTEDLLIVRLAGKVPTPCHIVSIERALTDVEPPAFVARMRINPLARCMAPEPPGVDFEAVQAFRIGGARSEVVVHHAGGEVTVEVEELSVHDDVAESSKGRAVVGSPLLDPFGEPVEAYGYSRNYDLAEAVHDAIGKIPPRGVGIPDWLSTYSIVSMGAEIGGIAGFNHLKVTVSG